MDYAKPSFWNQTYLGLDHTGFGDRWTTAFLGALAEHGVERILDLGCGLGSEVMALARKGYDVMGLDYSSEAISIARSKCGPAQRFIEADMAEPLPFPNDHFDAVMSNVAAHMFPDRITRSLSAEVGRIVRTGGLLLFHLNSLEDRPLRALAKPVERELEEDFVLESDGQTMHFFSKAYLLDLLSDWEELELVPVEILRHGDHGKYLHRVMEGYPGWEDNEERNALLDEGYKPIKRVWRGVFRR